VSPIEISVPDLYRERIRVVAVASLIVLAFAVWLGLEVPRGMVFGTDELLTAERSREMLMTEPWVVHYNFEHSFEKPPLQYWLTSLTLPRFHNHAVAVRIWPLVYGVLTAAALGWLAFLVRPDKPRLIPLAISLLVAEPLFSAECTRGLLDVGLAFFTVMTIVFAELARRNPKWWLGAAIACWLGSLQKVPVPFLILILILILRLTNREERANLRKVIGWLVGSMLLALALMSLWPLLQLLKYQMPVFSVFHEEVVVLLGPTELGRRPYFEIPITLSRIGGLCGFLSFLAPFVVLFSRKERPAAPVREIALVCLALMALLIVTNFRSVRYVTPILPALSLLLALVFMRFLKQESPVRTRAIVALSVVLVAGLVQAEIQIASRHKNAGDEKLIAEKLGELQQPGAKTVLIKAVKTGTDLIWDSFYLFHGNFRFPVTKLTVDEIRSNPPKPPVVGACVVRDFPVVKELYPNAQVQLARAQFVCWQVPAE
jgi:4-amino-4-deoxy-L-arabinose transferase-like glycosyltransferase